MPLETPPKGFAGSGTRTRRERKAPNIDKVNELVCAGMALEEAVLHAWTVTRARKRGFGTVFVHEALQDAAGAYTRVVVLIQKG